VFCTQFIHDSNDFVERSDKEAQREITFQDVLETISSRFLNKFSDLFDGLNSREKSLNWNTHVCENAKTRFQGLRAPERG